MATTNAEIIAIAKAVADCAKKLKQAKFLADQTLARNAVEAFDWGDADAKSANAALTEAQLSYDSAEVSNAIGSLALLQTWWDTHGQNFEKLVDPIV